MSDSTRPNSRVERRSNAALMRCSASSSSGSKRSSSALICSGVKVPCWGRKGRWALSPPRASSSIGISSGMSSDMSSGAPSWLPPPSPPPPCICSATRRASAGSVPLGNSPLGMGPMPSCNCSSSWLNGTPMIHSFDAISTFGALSSCSTPTPVRSVSTRSPGASMGRTLVKKCVSVSSRCAVSGRSVSVQNTSSAV